jgi:hypothetical protein
MFRASGHSRLDELTRTIGESLYGTAAHEIS